MNTPERHRGVLPSSLPAQAPDTAWSAPITGRRSLGGRSSGGIASVHLLRELQWGVGIALVGSALVGAGWAMSIHLVQRWSYDDEGVVAQDGTLGLLGVVVGVVTGLLLIAFPSRTPAVRAGVGILASVLGAGLAFGLGRQLGAPELLAYGMLLIWPITTSVVVLVRSVIGLLLQNE